MLQFTFGHPGCLHQWTYWPFFALLTRFVTGVSFRGAASAIVASIELTTASLDGGLCPPTVVTNVGSEALLERPVATRLFDKEVARFVTRSGCRRDKVDRNGFLREVVLLCRCDST